MAMSLHSIAFANGEEIPRRYTCGGADNSPALTWTAAPRGTRSLALIADDPDAPMGTWTHWLIWNIPAEPAELAEGISPAPNLESGAHQGRNDFQRIGYGGPCPPPGRTHHYFFHLYALDSVLQLPSGATRPELERAMRGHILEQADCMGTYHR